MPILATRYQKIINFLGLVVLFSSVLLGCRAKTAVASASVETIVVKPFKRNTEKKDSSNTFPGSWLGIWQGNLEIYNRNGLSQTVPMALELLATDTVGVYKWHIVYGPDREKGLRAYLLRTLDAEKGWYATDEGNSINLECYYLGGKLFSTYIVEGNFITVIEEKTTENGEEVLKFEIIFGKEKPVSTTGGTIMGSDTIPSVRTLPVIISQRAVLKRKISPKH
jgi:hypothetical protein